MLMKGLDTYEMYKYDDVVSVSQQIMLRVYFAKEDYWGSLYDENEKREFESLY
jgi:hypothetical protein